MQLERNGKERPSCINSIDVNNICFSYSLNDSNKSILNSFSCAFQKGSIYAVRGDNGIGKSTLMNIILGLYQNLSSGTITYDNFDLSELDMYYLRQKKISIVSQTITFIDDTIAEAFQLSENEFLEFINSFGHNSLFRNESFDIISLYNKNINELSGGERQKIALCHALIKKPLMLILDEPTSSLDANSIHYFIDLLQQLKNDIIIIVITHDKSIQKNSDFLIQL
jgi:ATP-binding cassette subfamily C protein